MFYGVHAHHNADRVTDYDTALRCLERCKLTPTGRQREPGEYGYPLGVHYKKSATKIRREGGDIHFRLYNTDVVTHHENGSVTIRNYGTKTTSDFAWRFVPEGFHLSYKVSRHGNEAGHEGVYYCDEAGRKRVCFGSEITFDPVGAGWEPDAASLQLVVFPVLDRARARKATKDIPLKDFETWLSMAPRHMDLDWDCWSLDDCVDALERRDFATAALFIPRIEIPRGFGEARNWVKIPIHGAGFDHCFTLGSVTKLKQAIWHERGAYDTVTAKTFLVPEFENHMRRVKQLAGLAIFRAYGPD